MSKFGRPRKSGFLLLKIPQVVCCKPGIKNDRIKEAELGAGIKIKRKQELKQEIEIPKDEESNSEFKPKLK